MIEGPLVRCDVLVTPTCRRTTPMAANVEIAGGPAMDRMIGELSDFARPISYLGLPALSTPMGFSQQGLPMGLQLIGRPQGEAQLLQVGAAFEAASRWTTHAPPQPEAQRQ
jgi:aspartyl-tRNA(Asn)/glutamyl-tRNA(Gln) amidotransferase subunit A